MSIECLKVTAVLTTQSITKFILMSRENFNENNYIEFCIIIFIRRLAKSFANYITIWPNCVRRLASILEM